MNRQTALARLRSVEPELRRRGVEALYLFGSSARNEARPDSDVDLFFDYSPSSHMSLLDVIGIRHFLQDALATRIDIMTRDSLHPLLRADIEAEAVAVF